MGCSLHGFLRSVAFPPLRELCQFSLFHYFVFVVSVRFCGASATVCGLWRFLSPHVDIIG
jgi:hypothetical protein